MAYSLILKKESFKFSASHFTIFGPQNAEALHGHNYQVGVRASFDQVDQDLEMKLDFKKIKDQIKAICESLDEKILVPEKSPHLKVSASPHYKNHTQVQYSERFYCFPKNEVVLLPLSNITSEALARYVAQKLSSVFKKEFKKITVVVSETAGQSASYSI